MRGVLCLAARQAMTNAVHDNPARKRFELEVDGETAYTMYRRSPGIVTFVHTVVPAALEGRGVGSTLARGALEQVRAHGDKVVAECRFIAAYMAKHPEVQDLLVDAPAPPRAKPGLPRGVALLLDPLLNKGTAFTLAERAALGL